MDGADLGEGRREARGLWFGVRELCYAYVPHRSSALASYGTMFAASRCGKTLEIASVTFPRRPLYFIECSPIMLPSVSRTNEMKPYSPMGNFGRSSFPPASTARCVVTAQSSHEK